MPLRWALTEARKVSPRHLRGGHHLGRDEVKPVPLWVDLTQGRFRRTKERSSWHSCSFARCRQLSERGRDGHETAERSALRCFP